MNTLVKSALMSLLAHAIEAEPAVAGEVLNFLSSKAVPELDQYVTAQVPALLAKLQTSLTGAGAPVNIKVLPAPVATAAPVAAAAAAPAEVTE